MDIWSVKMFHADLWRNVRKSFKEITGEEAAKTEQGEVELTQVKASTDKIIAEERQRRSRVKWNSL